MKDLLFNFQCMIQGARVYVLNELLYNYYIGRNDSIINTIKERIWIFCLLLMNYL